jgi:leucyl aminopeptidase (aminopeptidase T)
MRDTRFAGWLGVAAMLFVSHAPSAAVDPQAVADGLVRRMALQRGERVLLVAVPGAWDTLVPLVRARVRAAGALDLGALAARGDTPEAWSTSFTRSAAGKTLGAMNAHLAGVDLAVMMPGATVSDVPYAAMQNVLRAGKGRTIHFHWAGAYGLDGALQALTPAMEALYDSALRRTDYAALSAVQQRFTQAMRGVEVRVQTPAGTDLWFRIGDRPVTMQDGDASAARARSARNLIDREIELPAGAIRVAPVEESVNGRIVFPPSAWGGERAEGVVLTFSRGRVVSVDARAGRDAVERELAQAGDAARWFREFALGFNPLLAIPSTGEKWIPYYGYGAGVVRLSLGDNTELGGRIGGGYVRWNFFTDATVVAGNQVWVKDGKLVR